jgi:hypothetical protein
MKRPYRYVLPFLWLLIMVMFLIGPFTVGRVGTYMRFIGDDYCYASALKSGGFFRGQIDSFQMVARFNGDRYSLTLLLFVTELFGPKGNAAAVPVMITLWLAGLFLFIFQLLKTAGYNRAWGPSLATMSAITFFFLLTKRDLVASMYWIPAMYSYFAPMVFIIWLSALILILIQAKKISFWQLLILFFGTWIFGAFSEIGNVVQIVWVSLIALVSWRIEKREFWDRHYRLFIAAIFGSLLALVIMMLSPYARGFFHSDVASIDFGELVLRILRSSAAYNFQPWQGFTTPFMIELGLFAAMGYLLSGSIDRRRPSIKVFILIITAILFFGWILITVAFSPSQLVLNYPPTSRAATPAEIIRHLEYTSIYLVTGWFLGRILYEKKRIFSVSQLVAVSFLLLVSLYPVRAYSYFVENESFMKKWALFWDQREEKIRDAASKGESRIEVMMLDHPIPWVAELGKDPAANYNRCAQEYYGITEIIACLPGWDDFELP